MASHRSQQRLSEPRPRRPGTPPPSPATAKKRQAAPKSRADRIPYPAYLRSSAPDPEQEAVIARGLAAGRDLVRAFGCLAAVFLVVGILTVGHLLGGILIALAMVMAVPAMWFHLRTTRLARDVGGTLAIGDSLHSGMSLGDWTGGDGGGCGGGCSGGSN